ncbi:hypothetical protein [Amycolatopsis alkalitolerans]|uniref:Uncharacterized protein n=1 Tax=Amycolatopsis alkalitolerans TaxID=2547244 RepID=A0A5C4M9P8_9PSEU|nr:hypothetical protein [Amycolatopsis alkalitolerans]TNC28518.1 hypothetical protein FG385_04380 [Amycolatopsis alkalitolerans]
MDKPEKPQFRTGGQGVNAAMPGAIQTEEELESFPDQDEVHRRVLVAGRSAFCSTRTAGS